ncbi:hypothetical protein CRUP_034952, partial [Coryphaenoides rupestris]
GGCYVEPSRRLARAVAPKPHRPSGRSEAASRESTEKSRAPEDSATGTLPLRVFVPAGYPFPTAPPVDPFAKIKVIDCGVTKGCVSYRRIGTDVEYEMSADTDGWVAVGFSSDKKMGGDDVMGCVHDDNGRVRIHHFYNVGQWAKEIKRNPARDEEGVFSARCTSPGRRRWWTSTSPGSITRHDIDAPPVSERMISIYKYEDIFMPSTAYQTFNSPFCLLLIVALTFYLLMGTP